MRIILGAALGGVLALAASVGPATAGIQERKCFVMEAAAYTDRVHVFCATPGMSLAEQIRSSPEHVAAVEKDIADAAGKPPFYALSINDPMAEKVLILAQGSIAAGRALQIDFDDDPAHNPPGCGVSDCRRIVGVRLVPYD